MTMRQIKGPDDLPDTPQLVIVQFNKDEDGEVRIDLFAMEDMDEARLKLWFLRKDNPDRQDIVPLNASGHFGRSIIPTT